MKTAVIVLSGGLDSACTASILTQRYNVKALTFEYGQRASKEVHAAIRITEYLNIETHKIIDISFMRHLYGTSNVLTDISLPLPKSTEFNTDLSVPVRNGIMLSILAGWAFSINAEVVSHGEGVDLRPGDDPSDSLPDFALGFIKSINHGESYCIGRGKYKPLKFWSPAVDGIEKLDLIRAGYRRFGDKIFGTWSCYDNKELHCGRCAACVDRKFMFQKLGYTDKTGYLE